MFPLNLSILLLACLSPVQSQWFGIPSDSVNLAAGMPLSPVQFQLLTCAAGYQRASVDALLFPV